jgi:hypothetical protein
MPGWQARAATPLAHAPHSAWRCEHSCQQHTLGLAAAPGIHTNEVTARSAWRCEAAASMSPHSLAAALGLLQHLACHLALRAGVSSCQQRLQQHLRVSSSSLACGALFTHAKHLPWLVVLQLRFSAVACSAECFFGWRRSSGACSVRCAAGLLLLCSAVVAAAYAAACLFF